MMWVCLSWLSQRRALRSHAAVDRRAFHAGGRALVPNLVPKSADITPGAHIQPGVTRLYRAKLDPRAADPRVGGSSPSSGTPRSALEWRLTDPPGAGSRSQALRAPR